ncbi:MAG: zinc ribbon domain-containing protein [Bryobacteraceae bacterium]|nr:zinc ribbon domain-containing protein [Bryobacteraceae bacterium]
MPLYEYKCANCGEVFEVMQKFADAPLTTHEGCGGAVERLISSPALQFKGTGWYITDYAKGKGGGKGNGKSNGDSGSSEKESKPAAAAGSSAKSESSTPAAPSTPSK